MTTTENKGRNAIQKNLGPMDRPTNTAMLSVSATKKNETKEKNNDNEGEGEERQRKNGTMILKEKNNNNEEQKRRRTTTLKRKDVEAIGEENNKEGKEQRR